MNFRLVPHERKESGIPATAIQPPPQQKAEKRSLKSSLEEKVIGFFSFIRSFVREFLAKKVFVSRTEERDREREAKVKRKVARKEVSQAVECNLSHMCVRDKSDSNRQHR